MDVKKILLLTLILSQFIKLYAQEEKWELQLVHWTEEASYSNNSFDIDTIEKYKKTVKKTYFTPPVFYRDKPIFLTSDNHIGYSKILLNDKPIAELGSISYIQNNSLGNIRNIKIDINKNMLVGLNSITIVSYYKPSNIITSYKITTDQDLPHLWQLLNRSKLVLPVVYALMTIVMMFFLILFKGPEANEKFKYYVILLIICVTSFVLSGSSGDTILSEQFKLLSYPFKIASWLLSIIFYITSNNIWNKKQTMITGSIIFFASLGLLIIYNYNTSKIDIMIIYSLVISTLNIFFIYIVFKKEEKLEHFFRIALIISLLLNITNFILLCISPFPVYGLNQTAIFVLILAFFMTTIEYIKKSNISSALYNNKLLDSIEKAKVEITNKDNEISDLKSKNGEVLREKALFFSALGSNLRAPLNSIIGYSENLYTTEDIKEVNPLVTEIIIESDKIFQAINNVMDFSTRDFTNSDLLLKDFRMKEIYDNSVYHSSIITAFSKNINCEVIDNSDKVLIHGNPTIYKQVVESVMLFLIELNPEKMNYKIYNTGLTDDYINLAVQFTALNIRDSELSVITSERSNKSTFAKYIKLYNVDFEENVSDENYSILLKFQCSVSKDSLQKSIVPKNLILEKNISVLVVEDYIPNLNIVKMHLEKMGCNVLTATNGEEAISIFNNEVVDIILMDIKMPIMDGWEATEVIRSTKKGLNVPIVGLTASSLDLDIRHCFESGMDDVQVKPIRKNQLFNKLNSFDKYTPEKLPSRSSLRADYELSKAETDTLFSSSIKQIEKQLEVIEILTSAGDDSGIEREIPAVIHAALTINAFYYSRLLRNFFDSYHKKESQRQKELLLTLKEIIQEVKDLNEDIFGNR